MSVLLVWLIILLLIAINALYVAAEFAAVGVRRGQVRALAQKGNRLAAALLPVLEDTHRLDRYIAACQIGITLSSLVLGAFGQATLTLGLAAFLREWAGLGEGAALPTAATVVLVFLTAVQVVFGELVPKSLALQFPTQLALWTHPPMRWSLAFFAWFIVVLNGSGWLLMKAMGFGAGGGGHRHIHSPEEIEMLVVESHDGGLLEPNEQRRLRQALRLSRRTARELMVPRRFVQMVDIETPPDELLRIISESPYTRLPVYRDTVDNVLGFLHTRDLAAGYTAQGSLAVEPVLRPILGVPSEMDFERLLPLLRHRGQRLALVLDEFGGVEGIVSLADVVSELLGNVADEFAKRGEPRPERLPDGRVRLPGTLRLTNAAQWTGVTWRNPEVTTLAGHVLSHRGEIPTAGEKLTIDGVVIEVERVEHHAITSLLVTPRPVQPESSTD